MVADGVNTPDTRHVRSLFVNLAIIAGVILALLFVLDMAASYLTPYIPFSWETELVDGSMFESDLDEEDTVRRDELRRLAARVADAMDLPEGMTVTVHYMPGSTVNAFATLGGNIMIFQGLLDTMQFEDELAMVLAHEMGHVKHRDIVRGVVRAAGLGLVMIGLQDSTGVVQRAAGLGMAGYSRSQEEAADAEAVKALGRIYGHAAGAGRFFRTLAFDIEKKTDGAVYLPPILSSHPDSRVRLREVERVARANGIATEGELTPLSAVFSGAAVVD